MRSPCGRHTLFPTELDCRSCISWLAVTRISVRSVSPLIQWRSTLNRFASELRARTAVSSFDRCTASKSQVRLSEGAPFARDSQEQPPLTDRCSAGSSSSVPFLTTRDESWPKAFSADAGGGFLVELNENLQAHEDHSAESTGTKGSRKKLMPRGRTLPW